MDIGFGTLVHPGNPMGGIPPRAPGNCRLTLSASFVIPFRQWSVVPWSCRLVLPAAFLPGRSETKAGPRLKSFCRLCDFGPRREKTTLIEPFRTLNLFSGLQ